MPIFDCENGVGSKTAVLFSKGFFKLYTLRQLFSLLDEALL